MMGDITKDKDYVKTIITVLNEDDNGGEAVTLTTHVFDNGDDGNGGEEMNPIYTISEISLESYGRSATIDLGDAFDGLGVARHLQELDKVIKKVEGSKS